MTIPTADKLINDNALTFWPLQEFYLYIMLITWAGKTYSMFNDRGNHKDLGSQVSQIFDVNLEAHCITISNAVGADTNMVLWQH